MNPTPVCSCGLGLVMKPVHLIGAGLVWLGMCTRCDRRVCPHCHIPAGDFVPTGPVWCGRCGRQI